MIRLRRGAAVALLFLTGMLAMLPATADASQEPMRIAVGPAAHVGSWTVYRLRLLARGTPVLLVVPGGVPYAELDFDGAPVQRVGSEVNLGSPPFGHGGSAFHMSAFPTGVRVEIRMRGPAATPRIASDLPELATAFRSGLWSGSVIGVLVAIALLQLITALAQRERTLLWYVAWVFSIVLIEVALTGLLPTVFATEQVFLAFVLFANFTFVGFAATYLKLASEARPLLWLLIAANVAAALTPPLIGALTHRPPTQGTFFLPNAISTAVAIGIALWRRRDGFKPASYVALASVAILAVFLDKVLRDQTGSSSAFLDRWASQCGHIFDFAVFSIGLAYRARFTLQERQSMEAALGKASAAAAHDQLTGLLNRRGLEGYVADLQAKRGAILFIDLDGFKAINDRGGHAAGDDTLTIVARVILHAVRTQDAVSRVGGDEFVIFLNECDDLEVVQLCISRITAAVALIRPLGESSDVRVGVSIGHAFVDSLTTFAAALAEADGDAYRVKAQHRAAARETAHALSREFR